MKKKKPAPKKIPVLERIAYQLERIARATELHAITSSGNADEPTTAALVERVFLGVPLDIAIQQVRAAAQKQTESEAAR